MVWICHCDASGCFAVNAERVSDIVKGVFVLKRDVKFQLTANC